MASVRSSTSRASRSSGVGADRRCCWSSGPKGATAAAWCPARTGSVDSSMVAGRGRVAGLRGERQAAAQLLQDRRRESGGVGPRRRVGPVLHVGPGVRVVGQPAPAPGSVARRPRRPPTGRRGARRPRRCGPWSRCRCGRPGHRPRCRARSAPRRTHDRRPGSRAPAPGTRGSNTCRGGRRRNEHRPEREHRPVATSRH